MKYIHLFSGDEDEKFSSPFYTFIKEEFKVEDHFFYIPEHSQEKRIMGSENVEYFKYEIIWSLKFLKKALFSEKIIIHKIPHNIYFFLLFVIFPFLAKKSVWFVWGGDLYYYKYRTRNIKSSIVEIFRKIILRRIRYIVTHLHGDYELARKWYNVKGKHLYSFMYPSNLFKQIDSSLAKVDDRLVLQIGNSACMTNNHLELLENLEFLKDENVVLYCPLSYSGKEEYITKVIESGYRIFGKEKFVPMLEFMPHESYMKFLARVDVTVLNHERQRGLGNITSLLSLGKKVYINECVSTWDFCRRNNIRVFSIETELVDILIPLSNGVKYSNKNIVRSLLSVENLKRDLREVFES